MLWIALRSNQLSVCTEVHQIRKIYIKVITHFSDGILCLQQLQCTNLVRPSKEMGVPSPKIDEFVLKPKCSIFQVFEMGEGEEQWL